MKKIVNAVTITGYLYQHSLTMKTVQRADSPNFGQEFINGTIEIATDENGLNIIPVRFTYVTPLKKDKTENKTYTALAKILDGGATWISNGKDAALKVKCDTAFAVNDFYGRDDQLVSQMMQEGGFVTIVNELPPEKERNKFELDFLITGMSRQEVDEEKHIDKEYATLRGASFDFRGALLPMTFKVTNPQGIEYFESLDATNANPVFTKLRGKIVSQTVKIEKYEESAFGEAAVSIRERKVKEWIVDSAATSPYDYGEEKVLTEAEVVKAMQDRQVHLADVKTRTDEYRANKTTSNFAAAPSQSSAPKATTALFDF